MEKVSKQSSQQKTGNIIDLILTDHKPIKECLKILKKVDADVGERLVTFDKFAHLLITHAKAEEQSLYAVMQESREFKLEGLEGETEHSIAEQLINEIFATNSQDEWSAKVKVLAELVEHHLEEEETELLPHFKKKTDIKKCEEMGEEYLLLKNNFENKDAVSQFNKQSEQIQEEHFHH